MNRPAASMISLLCLALPACDASTEADPCPAKPDAAVSDYFPLEVGQTRVFDYAFHEASQTPWTVTGVMTWRVVSAGECAFGRQTFTVEESLVYDSPDLASRSRTLTFSVHDSLVYPGPYFFEGLPRFQPPTAPDTLEFHSDDPRSIYGFDNDHGTQASVRLVRNKGLVSRIYFYHGGVVFDVSEVLVIKDE